MKILTIILATCLLSIFSCSSIEPVEQEKVIEMPRGGGY